MSLRDLEIISTLDHDSGEVRLMDSKYIEGMAHEIWAAAQLLPSEGIEDGVERISQILAQTGESSKRMKTALEGIGGYLMEIWAEMDEIEWRDAVRKRVADGLSIEE